MLNSPRDMQSWMQSVERRLRDLSRAGRGTTAEQITRAVDEVREEVVGGGVVDTRIPAAPVSIVYSTSIYTDNNARPRAALSVNFPPVLYATSGSQVSVDRYELWGREWDGVTGTAPAWALVATARTPSFVVKPFNPGEVWQFRIRAMGDTTTLPGDFSTVATVTMVTDTVPPPIPATPTVETVNGVFRITWVGGVAGGGSMPADFAYVELAMGSEPNPTLLTGYRLGGAGTIVITGIPYGETRYFRLRAFDTTGNASAWSANSAATSRPLVQIDGISLQEILTEQYVAAQTAADTANALRGVADAKAADAALGQQQADTAQAAADAALVQFNNTRAIYDPVMLTETGKTTIAYQGTAPTGSSTVLWIDTGTSIAKVWNGSAWVDAADPEVTNLLPLTLGAWSAWNQAQAAADTAQAAAGALASDAAAADGAAAAAEAAYGAALFDATATYQSSLGGSQITYSITDPETPWTGSAGDVWFKRNESGTVIGQWEWDGADWLPRTVGSEVIANLDVGKLTAGAASIDTLAAQKIAAETAEFIDLAAENFSANLIEGDWIKAGAITTEKLQLGAVGQGQIKYDLTDRTANPIWADSVKRTVFPVPVGSSWSYSTTPGDLPAGQSHVVAIPPSATPYSMPVGERQSTGPGERFYVRMVARRPATSDWVPSVDLSVQDIGGSPLSTPLLTPTWTDYLRTNYALNPGAEVDTSNFTGASATLARDTGWSASGGGSFRLTSTGVADGYMSMGGDAGGMRANLERGRTYVLSAVCRLTGALTGTLNSRSRRIVVFWRIGSTYYEAQSNQAPNSAGETRVSLTVTIPLEATETFVRFYNGSPTVGEQVWWDDIAIEPTVIALRQNLVRGPRCLATSVAGVALLSSTGSSTVTISGDESYVGESCAKAVVTAANGGVLVPPTGMEAAIVGRTYRVSAWVKAASGTITLTAERVSAAGAATSAGTASVAADGTWRRLVVTGAVVSTDRWMRPKVTLGAAGTLYVDALQVEDAAFAAEGDYFDGTMKPAGYTIPVRWAGVPDASSSVLGVEFAPDETFWDGTAGLWLGTSYSSVSLRVQALPPAGEYVSWDAVITVPDSGLTFQPLLESPAGTTGTWTVARLTVWKVLQGEGAFGQSLEISPGAIELRGPNDDGQPDIYLGTNGPPGLVLRDAKDVPSVTLDGTDGLIVARSISATENLIVQGYPIGDFIAKMPRGVVVKGELSTNRSGITSEYGLFEVAWVMSADRIYKINGQVQTFPTGVASEMVIRLRITTDGSSPSLSSPSILLFRVGRVSADTYDIKHFSHALRSVSMGNVEGAQVRLLLTVERDLGTTLDVLAGYNTHIVVSDDGETVDQSGTLNTGGGGTTTALQTYDKTLTPEWRMDYGTSNTRYNYSTTRLYVGRWSASTQWAKTLIGFPNQMRSDIAGSNLLDIWVEVDNDHWGANSGVVVLGRHDHDSEPGTASWYQDGATYTNVGYGARVWLRLPNPWYSGFVAGTHKGVALYAPTTETKYYGYFNRSTTGAVRYRYRK